MTEQQNNVVDKINKLAEAMSDDNGLDIEVNAAYIELVGEEYATADNAQEAYAGEYASDEEFAQELAEELGAIDKDAKWPNTCIDWEQAARELMYDYGEQNGYYFRNL